MLPPHAFPLCRDWVDRWLPGDTHLTAAATTLRDRFDPLRWALGWADCAVRDIVPLALDSLDLPGQAAALRVIAPLEDEAACLDAIGRLDLAARTAAAMGPKYHFCSSARLAVQESMILFRAAEMGVGSLTEQLFRFEALFSESGALDMVIHRALAAGAPRDDVRALLLGRLHRLLLSTASAPILEIDAPDTEKELPADAREAAPPPFSWMAPVAGARSTLDRSG